MGRIVVTEFVSLDGVIEAPGGGEDYKHGGWTFEIDRGDEGDKFKLDELFEAEAQLLGRRTYEGFAAAWPEMNDEAGFAEKMNSMPKYVVSSTLRGGRVEQLDRARAATSPRRSRSCKQEVDGVILVAGSAQLVQGLLEHDLRRRAAADGLPGRARQRQAPLRRDRRARSRCKLTDSKTVGAGIAVLTYEPARAA